MQIGCEDFGPSVRFSRQHLWSGKDRCAFVHLG